MAYMLAVTDAGPTREIEKYYDYRTSRGKGEKRMPKSQISPEAKARLNERAACKNLRRLMNGNFTNDSWYLTMDCIKEPGLPYVTPDEMKSMLARFIRLCRAWWKKCGAELKYISVMAVGKHSARHFHLVLSSCGCGYKAMRSKLQEIWDKVYLTDGRTRKSFIHLENLYGDNYGDLANYFIKQSKTTMEALGRKIGRRWNASTNLVRPTTKKRRISNRQAFRLKPYAPKGWYIDERYTAVGYGDEYGGYEYMRYILIRMGGGRQDE